MKIWDNTKSIPEPYKFIAILWLSFLVAGIATSILFAFVDPEALQQCGILSVTNRMAAYTAGFFVFWFLTASSSLLTSYFFNTKE